MKLPCCFGARSTKNEKQRLLDKGEELGSITKPSTGKYFHPGDSAETQRKTTSTNTNLVVGFIQIQETGLKEQATKLAEDIVKDLIKNSDKETYILNTKNISGLQLLENIFNAIFVIEQYEDQPINAKIKEKLLIDIPEEIKLTGYDDHLKLRQKINEFEFRSKLRIELIGKQKFLENILNKAKINDDVIIETAFINSLTSLIYIKDPRYKLINLENSFTIQAHILHLNLDINNEQIIYITNQISKKANKLFLEKDQINQFVNFLFKNGQSQLAFNGIKNVTCDEIMKSILLGILELNQLSQEKNDPREILTSIPICGTISFNKININLLETVLDDNTRTIFNQVIMSRLSPEQIKIKIYRDCEYSINENFKQINAQYTKDSNTLLKIIYQILKLHNKTNTIYDEETVSKHLCGLYISDEDITRILKYSNEQLKKN